MPEEIMPALLATQAASRSCDSRRRRGLEPLKARCQRAAWNRNSAPQFVNHLLKTHHPHLEERLRRVEKSFVFMAAKHGLAHGNTWRLANIFVELADGIRGALESEFLLMGSLSSNEEGVETSSWRSEYEVFAVTSKQGTQEIDAMFRRIRSLSSEDVATKGRCPSYRAMLEEIASLEKDYRTHGDERTQYLVSLVSS